MFCIFSCLSSSSVLFLSITASVIRHLLHSISCPPLAPSLSFFLCLHPLALLLLCFPFHPPIPPVVLLFPLSIPYITSLLPTSLYLFLSLSLSISPLLLLPGLCVQQQAHGSGPLCVRQAMGQDEAGAPEHGGETPQRTDVEVSAHCGQR